MCRPHIFVPVFVSATASGAHPRSAIRSSPCCITSVVSSPLLPEPLLQAIIPPMASQSGSKCERSLIFFAVFMALGQPQDAERLKKPEMLPLALLRTLAVSFSQLRDARQRAALERSERIIDQQRLGKIIAPGASYV